MEKMTIKKLFKPAKRDLGQLYLICFYLLFILIITNTIVGAEEKLKDSYIIFGFLLLNIGYQIGKNRESIHYFFMKIKSKLTGKSKEIPHINQ
ncbi:MAG: hypothetical protein HZB41_04990 [Ignavibacteriae bacterium]|nr:hypothetical protein [Ignavibacteriota bacterium]